MITNITYSLSPKAQQIAEKRYFRKDENGKCIEDWDALCWRVVNNVERPTCRLGIASADR
jgi:hypothetical protein